MNNKSFKRKNELLEAALNEFTCKNYEDASLNTIIKNADISKGTFYYHFQNKEDLYLYLLETAVKTKWEFINNHMKENQQNFYVKDIFDEFKLQAQMGMEFAVGFPQYHKLSIMFAREKGNKIFEDAKKILKFDTESILKKMVKKGKERWDFKESFSEDFLVKILTHLFMNFDEIFDLEEDLQLEKLVENLDNYIKFIKYGIGR